MSNPVLLLMDYQKDICEPKGAIGSSGTGVEVVRRGVLEVAGRVLRVFRERQAPIIHARVAFDPGYHRMTSASERFGSIKAAGLLLEDDPGTAFCDEVAPAAGELVVTKGCVNAFVGTNLHEKLVPMRPSELVVGGVATNQVVESTVRYAADAGYRTVVLEDLCASFTEEMHRFSVEKILPGFGRVTTSNEYLATWR